MHTKYFMGCLHNMNLHFSVNPVDMTVDFGTNLINPVVSFINNII